ncbi:PREDICTED: uncharacterized protein LOC105562227 [Vollenhovia emeryi]|uniref:uncharacterized protein LOC105562227 n=1 Tax=Vollenhovia emeryi TaxID=411798 RepID=UPI0005F56B1E|nr:PREDICTED: uncharacterized protein LOC105562227 [Vollenhovia emeryi]
MLLMLSRILSRSNCILILVIFNLASSAPLKSQKHSPFQSEQGFSASPKILELQLPLKISSKEDLLAWSKYVMSLMASKINFMSPFKNLSDEKRAPFTSNPGSKSKETMKKAPLNEKRQGPNYPARRLKEPHMQRPDEKVVAYPLPIGAMKPTAPNPPQQNPSSFSTGFNEPTDFGQYMDFNLGNLFQQSEIDTFGNLDFLQQPPTNVYLPLPPIDAAKSYQSAIGKNVSGFGESARLQTMKNSLDLHIKTPSVELEQALPIAINNEFTGMNLSHIGEPLLTFPFQAVVTIAKNLPAATMISKMQANDYTAIGDLPREFLPYFEQNNLSNESGQINVVLNDFIADTSETKTRGNVKKGKEEKKEQNVREPKKQSQKKATNSTKKLKSSIKRQSSALGDLLRTLGILRKVPKNATEVNIATPLLSILKGTNSQKIQVALEEIPPPRGRRNETFLAQQVNGNDDDDENGNSENGNGESGNDENGNGENGNSENGNGENDDDDESQTEAQEDDDDDEEEEEGGSIQAVIDLLPLAAPILEELSDPDAEVDIAEVLQGAIPLLEGLSDPEEEGGVDIPAALLPLSQKLSEGPDGQGSDSGAILGPLIQLIAPLSGPLSGPLIGPLSRSSSGPDGVRGSASAFAASAEPLSKPQGPYGQSVLSGLIASITAKLSKESAVAAGDSDVKSLVSSIVSGVLAGASTGSKGHKGQYGYGQSGNNGNNRYGQSGYNNRYGQNGQSSNRDTYQSSTSYGGYHQSYGSYNKPSVRTCIFFTYMRIILYFSKLIEFNYYIFGAVLKLSATSSRAGASLSGKASTAGAELSAGSSESSQKPESPTYGPPAHPTYAAPPHPTYAAPPPTSYGAPPSTSSPYVSFTRRQIPRKQIKKF